VYVEFDDEETPVGEWHYDNEIGDWVFVEFPHIDAPKTGDGVSPFIFVLGLAAIGAAAVVIGKRRNRVK
jgi:LPXTG-motif cell wall-anchored protein